MNAFDVEEPMKSNHQICGGPRRYTAGFTLIELTIVVAVAGILAVIAIPNFIKFQARSKQSEAKSNLKVIYTAEKAFFQEKDTFSPNVSQIGFGPNGARLDQAFLYDIAFTPTSLSIHATPAVAGISGTQSCVVTVQQVPGAPWPPEVPPEPVCTPIPGAEDAQQMMFLKISGLGAAAVAGAIFDYADGVMHGDGTGPVTADLIRNSLAQPSLMANIFAAMDANGDGTLTMAEIFSYQRHAPGNTTPDRIADFLAASRDQISIIASDADLKAVGFTLSDFPPVLCSNSSGPFSSPCTVFPEVQSSFFGEVLH
jgi:prepilin-type N-terminal cleavage/methylation domain-containing protein